MFKSERRFKDLYKILVSIILVLYFIEKNVRDIYNLFIKKNYYLLFLKMLIYI